MRVPSRLVVITDERTTCEERVNELERAKIGERVTEPERTNNDKRVSSAEQRTEGAERAIMLETHHLHRTSHRDGAHQQRRTNRRTEAHHMD